MKIVDILESVAVNESRSAPLYHATSVFKAVSIVKENMIRANTSQYFNDKGFMGVSLTRDLRVARVFDNVANHSRIIFVLDQQKLAQKYKIKPVDFFTTHPDVEMNVDMHGGRRSGYYAEAEEFVFGPIANVSNYITKIIITKEAYNFNEDIIKKLETKPNPAAKEMAEKYLAIKNHPKTVIEK